VGIRRRQDAHVLYLRSRIILASVSIRWPFVRRERSRISAPPTAHV